MIQVRPPKFLHGNKRNGTIPQASFNAGSVAGGAITQPFPHAAQWKYTLYIIWADTLRPIHRICPLFENAPAGRQGWPVSTSWSRRNKFCKYWVMERLLKCPICSRAVQSCVGSELEISSEYELLCNLHMKFICPLFWIGEYNLWLMNSSYKYAPQAKKIQSSAWNY